MPTVNTHDFARTLGALMGELVYGSPDLSRMTFMLNRGDEGLLQSLEKISADAASQATNGGGSIAAHVDHVRYGLSLLNRWASGEPDPWKQADWTESWREQHVSEAAWRTLRDDLRRQSEAWIEVLRTPRDVGSAELRWVTGSIAHLAYHLGAIRQIDRATRGPTADDDHRATRAL